MDEVSVFVSKESNNSQNPNQKFDIYVCDRWKQPKEREKEIFYLQKNADKNEWTIQSRNCQCILERIQTMGNHRTKWHHAITNEANSTF